MKNENIRITKLSVGPKEEPIFSERITHVSIEDESGGEYVALKQHLASKAGVVEQEILIEKCEWEDLKEAIDFMIGECRDGKPIE